MKKRKSSAKYCPKTLEECFTELDRIFKEKEKNEIRKMSESDFTIYTHRGVGMWIRDEWLRHGDIELTEHFADLGIYHPDDISGIIFDSYYRRLTDKPIELDTQVESYKRFWYTTRQPSMDEYPEKVKDLHWKCSCFYTLLENQSCLHILEDKASDKIWLFDRQLGWKMIDSPTLATIESNMPISDIMVMQIFDRNDMS